MTTYSTKNGTVAVLGDDNEVIEEFEFSGCIYRHLNMCQGCPICRYDDDNDNEEGEW